VVTNVDKEHLDYFKTFKNVIREFRNFIVKLPADGWLVFNNDDKFIPRFKRPLFAVSPFSLRQKDSVKLKKILKIPGKHNILNALAALSVARILRVEDSISFASLSEYTGSWRRFDVKQGIFNGKKITVVGDYGHHPTEILATLRAAREKYPRKKIWCVFQPHQFQRTFYLFKDFIAVFKKITIDHVIITDIYDVAGREEIKINQSVSVEKLVKRINRKNTQYMPLGAAEQFVKENIKNGEVLIIMGAGDVYKLADKF
jgi:UDP-N-acetylmuramate--alanine ligase